MWKRHQWAILIYLIYFSFSVVFCLAVLCCHRFCYQKQLSLFYSTVVLFVHWFIWFGFIWPSRFLLSLCKLVVHLSLFIMASSHIILLFYLCHIKQFANIYCILLLPCPQAGTTVCTSTSLCGVTSSFSCCRPTSLLLWWSCCPGSPSGLTAGQSLPESH